MNDFVKLLPTSVGIGEGPEALSLVHCCPAAIWRRRSLTGFQAWIDKLPAEQLPLARMILPAQRVRQAVTETCATSGTPDCPQRQRLIDDAAALGEIFSRVMGSTYLQLRFDVVTTNACRKFHVDAVKARLVCTYRGTGTQYTTATDQGEPGQVHTVPTGAPIVLRGLNWQPGTKPRLFHRSPPIEGSGETRLVYVLDAVDEPEGLPKPGCYSVN